jgi:hypothetical protein
MGAARGVDDMDAEEGRLGAAGEDEGPTHLQVVVLDELWLAAAEIALPYGVVVDLNGVQRLATAALFHHGVRQRMPPIVSMKQKGSGRRTLHPARRGARKVVNPCSEV